MQRGRSYDDISLMESYDLGVRAPSGTMPKYDELATALCMRQVLTMGLGDVLHIGAQGRARYTLSLCTNA